MLVGVFTLCYIGTTTFYQQTHFSMGHSFDRYNFYLHF